MIAVKSLIMTANRMIGLTLLVTFCAITALAQEAKLQIDQLDKLSDKAIEVVEVTLDERLLKAATRFLSQDNPTEAKVKEIVSGLKGVYVRSFEFEKPGEYSLNDLDSIRAQLRHPGWQKIVSVTNRREGENIEVFLRYQGENIAGLAIVAAESKQLTVVNIIGPIDLEKLRQLEGQLGIPKLNLPKTDQEKGVKNKPRGD